MYRKRRTGIKNLACPMPARPMPGIYLKNVMYVLIYQIHGQFAMQNGSEGRIAETWTEMYSC